MITFHSDDFGYSKKTDRKILTLIKKGKIQSVSVLSNMVSKKSLEELASLYSSSERSESRSSSRQARTINIFLHLNIVEKNMYKNLFEFFLAVLTRQIDADHVEKEICNQLSILEKAGIRVGGIDSHQHTHAVSPVAQLVQKIASDKNISIRNYADVEVFTGIAKLKYYFLTSVALLSHIIWYQKFGLPVSWKQMSFRAKSRNLSKIPPRASLGRDDNASYSFMSWEGKSLDLATLKSEKLIAVTHPYLNFDSNKSYEKVMFYPERRDVPDGTSRSRRI